MQDMAHYTPDAANAAAMREGLEHIEKLTREFNVGNYSRPDYTQWVLDSARFALAAPPRNCDRYADRETAWDAFAASYFGPTDPGEMEYYFGVWLFAPAVPREGGRHA